MVKNQKIKKNLKKLLLQSLSTLRKLKHKYKDIKTEYLITKTETDCHNILKKYENCFKMIDEGDIENIKSCLKINFREINDKGNTVLHHCIDTGDIYILKNY